MRRPTWYRDGGEGLLPCARATVLGGRKDPAVTDKRRGLRHFDRELRIQDRRQATTACWPPVARDFRLLAWMALT